MTNNAEPLPEVLKVFKGARLGYRWASCPSGPPTTFSSAAHAMGAAANAWDWPEGAAGIAIIKAAPGAWLVTLYDGPDHKAYLIPAARGV